MGCQRLAILFSFAGFVADARAAPSNAARGVDVAASGLSAAAEARGQALADQGNFLEAAQSLAEALRLAGDAPEDRGRRSLLATEAVNSYRLAFEANPFRCEILRVGMHLADEFLFDLRVVHGQAVIAADDYTGMIRARAELEKSRDAHGCPVHRQDPVMAASSAPPPPPPRSRAPTATPSRPPPGRDVAIGIGVTAGLTAILGLTGIVTYTQVRNPEGRAYQAIRTAAVANGVDNDLDTDMCLAGKGVADVVKACRRWTSLRDTYLATTVMSGLFATATLVLTAVLIRDRYQATGPAARIWRRQQGAVGAVPALDGASIVARIRF